MSAAANPYIIPDGRLRCVLLAIGLLALYAYALPMMTCALPTD